MSPVSNLRLTFTSDFSQFGSGATGTQHWNTTLAYHLRTLSGNGELEYYSDSSVGSNPFTLVGSELDITATRTPNAAGLPYTSGAITTQGQFSQLYGYFEISAQLPAGTGMWPAFWLLPAHPSGTQELDVFEFFGRTPTQSTTSVHSPSSGVSTTAITTTDLTKGFHTYGLYWTPTTISSYIDGQLVSVARTPADMNSAMYMIANLAVSHDANAQTPASATLQIANIRAYAYDPSVPGPVDPLQVTLPSAINGHMYANIAVTGVKIIDSGAGSTQPISVTISDKSLGILSLGSSASVTVSGNNSTAISLRGTLTDINIALAGLVYRNSSTTSAVTSDTITIAANDTLGDMDSARVTIGLSPNPQPHFIQLGLQPSRVVASGSDVFVLQSGQIADPHANAGVSDQIVNFHTAGTKAGDFIALHGFAADAVLVFDHAARVGGVIDNSVQYYRVDSSTGSSPIFAVQMINHATTHLGNADYGFYAT